MGHAGRAACRLHFESLFEPFVSVPETHASPEENGHDGDVHEVDEVGLDEFANGRRTPTNADVQSSGGLSRDLQGSDRAGVDEIEGRSALHLEGWVGEVGEHDDGSVKRWVVAPPALPTVVDPGASLGSELVTAGDLGSDPRRPIAGKEIVDTRGPARPTVHGLKGPGVGEPLQEPLAGMAKRCFEALTLTRGETVEGDREIVDPDGRHWAAPDAAFPADYISPWRTGPAGSWV